MQLTSGITPAGQGLGGVVWNVLGHTYWPKSEADDCFCFETLDPPGSFVPPHVHPYQDELIYVLEGSLDLRLGDARLSAGEGALVRMPRGLPHAYYNNTDRPTRALFWVTPAGRLRQLFDELHDLADLGEVVRLSKLHEVDFLPPD
jgi:uncharacterized cupin superfamily protein